MYERLGGGCAGRPCVWQRSALPRQSQRRTELEFCFESPPRLLFKNPFASCKLNPWCTDKVFPSPAQCKREADLRVAECMAANPSTPSRRVMGNNGKSGIFWLYLPCPKSPETERQGGDVGACAARAPALVVLPARRSLVTPVWGTGMHWGGSKPLWSGGVYGVPSAFRHWYLESHCPQLPRRRVSGGRGSSCLFAKCWHCWARGGTSAALREPRLGLLPTPPAGDCRNVGCPWPKGCPPHSRGAGEDQSVCPSVCLPNPPAAFSTVFQIALLFPNKSCFANAKGGSLGRRLLPCPPIGWWGGRGEARDSD